MKKLELKTTIYAYEDETHLPAEDQQLLSLAVKSLEHSYSPYSNFKVGAALLLENGALVPGSNQENAAYPLCLCAERVALAAAAAQHPGIAVVAIAVTARNTQNTLFEPVSPCGSCRQVLVESENRSNSAMRVLLQGQSGQVYRFDSAKDLLPLSFNGEVL